MCAMLGGEGVCGVSAQMSPRPSKRNCVQGERFGSERVQPERTPPTICEMPPYLDYFMIIHVHLTYILRVPPTAF